MVKIGNLFLIGWLWTIAVCAAPSVKISVYDANHRSVTQIGQYSQFMIEVTCTDMSVSKSPENIPGFDECQAQSISQKHSTQVYNGHTTRSVTFVYTAQCPEQGEYVLGPCIIDGVKSNTISLKVVQRTVNQQQASTHRSDVMIEAAVQGQDFFLGQAIPVTYTVRMSEDIDGQESDAHIMQSPYFDVGSVRTLGDVQYELHGGKEYKVETYQAFMYPKRVGTVSVPPMQVTYLVPSNHSMLSFFGLGGLSREKKATTSNVIPCVIKPLPQGVSENQFIGIIDSIQAQLEKTELTLGQGTILKIIVQGKGDYTKIPFFQIHTPDQLRVYENKEQVHSAKDGSFIKTLEYVVQGLQEGECIIPEQVFTYFDVQKEKIQKYRFCTDMSIQILPGSAVHSSGNQDESSMQGAVKDEETHADSQFVLSVSHDRLGVYAYWILWLWYILFFILLWLWLQKLFYIGLRHSIVIRKIYGYSIILWWRCTQSSSRNTHQLLAGWRIVFEKLSYVAQKEHVFKEHDYSVILQAMQIDEQTIQAWNAWYGTVLQQLYGQGGQAAVKDFLKESGQWTVLLQGKIWRIQ
ncbi:hypothetical protein EBR77_01025 [bacterium]|nr:hypothetical protein [bacterium]NBX78209.1 hypothetical protein [bacterium]